MVSPDSIYRILRSDWDTEKESAWTQRTAELENALRWGMKKSGYNRIYDRIQELYGNDLGMRILDFGCGGGQLVFYFRLLGYSRAYGIDIDILDKNIGFAKQLGIKDTLFIKYDGRTLPFESGCFDLVISQQVLEHVQDVENYYEECARILKKGGIGLFSFPHRLVPYDSHTKTWIIHYFPRSIRKLCLRILGRDPQYTETILNYKTPKYHKKIASRYFSRVIDRTSERLVSFDENALQAYEGNKVLRRMIDGMIRSSVIGPLVLPVLAQLSILDLELVK